MDHGHAEVLEVWMSPPGEGLQAEQEMYLMGRRDASLPQVMYDGSHTLTRRRWTQSNTSRTVLEAICEVLSNRSAVPSEMAGREGRHPS